VKKTLLIVLFVFNNFFLAGISKSQDFSGLENGVKIVLLMSNIYYLPLVNKEVLISKKQASLILDKLTILETQSQLSDPVMYLTFIKKTLSESQFSSLQKYIEDQSDKPDFVPNKTQIKILVKNFMISKTYNPFLKENFANGILRKTLDFLGKVK
jgi:hypothetical protein